MQEKEYGCLDAENFDDFTEIISYLYCENYSFIGTEPEISEDPIINDLRIELYHYREKIATKLQKYGNSRQEIKENLGNHIKKCRRCFKRYIRTLIDHIKIDLQEGDEIENFSQTFRKKDSELLDIL
jgi:hypothetical protein